MAQSGTLAYHKILKIGFPIQVEKTWILDIFKPVLDQIQITNFEENFIINILLNSCGFNKCNFKNGRTNIFFRKTSNSLNKILLRDIEYIQSIKPCLQRKLVFSKWHSAVQAVVLELKKEKEEKEKQSQLADENPSYQMTFDHEEKSPKHSFGLPCPGLYKTNMLSYLWIDNTL